MSFKKRVLLGTLALLMITAIVYGAATENAAGPVMQLTAIDADWKWTDDPLTAGEYNNGIRVNYIIFYPLATSNFISIKEGSDTGPELFPPVPATGASDSRIIYFNGAKLRPVLDYSACSTETGDSVIIQLWSQQ